MKAVSAISKGMNILPDSASNAFSDQTFIDTRKRKEHAHGCAAEENAFAQAGLADVKRKPLQE